MHPDFAQLSGLPSADVDSRFGRPHVYLSPRELARLAIVRSRLGDTRAERETEANRRPRNRPANRAKSGQLLA